MARAAGPTLDIAAARRITQALSSELSRATGEVRKGALRALRRTLSSGKTSAGRIIREEINLKAKVISERVSTKVISQRELTGKVTVRDKRVPLGDFLTASQLAREEQRWRGTGSRGPGRRRQKAHVGVSIKTLRKEPAKRFPGHFVATGRKTGKLYVLSRASANNGRTPIRMRYGPSLTAPFVKALPKFAEQSAATMQKNLEHEIGRALDRL